MNAVHCKNTKPVKSLDLTATCPANQDGAIIKIMYSLCLQYPDVPNHPDQRYRTVAKGGDA